MKRKINREEGEMLVGNRWDGERSGLVGERKSRERF